MNKSADVCDLIINRKLDILAITEAWLKGDGETTQSLPTSPKALSDYDIHQLPRIGQRGGGICVILHKGYDFTSVTHTFDTFECLELSISSSQRDALQLFVLYRPGSTSPSKLFFEEFSGLLESATLASGELVITGDFNIHMDDLDCQSMKLMSDILYSAGLKQHVTEPTHIRGHTLDLLITRDPQDSVSSVSVKRDLPSDHYAVMCDILLSRPPATKRVIKSRQLRAIDSGVFREGVVGSLSNNNLDGVSEKVQSFNSNLSNLLDKHAPLTTHCLKEALVTPLLKKPSLGVDDFKNFRPVSNLPLLGKVIERAAINQLQSYIKDNDLHTKNQSAYRQFHSVETALLRVTNDLLGAVDDHGEAVLDIIDNHGLASISYADDTQLYVVIKPSNRASALAKLEKCIEDILPPPGIRVENKKRRQKLLTQRSASSVE
ncbi:uncharacterized protein [Amphiura filiformis]|uniref:uncharacterized protein n=1 Tax=Amphiura filiformis TaxID=82378 RepID=UPI003B21C463